MPYHDNTGLYQERANYYYSLLNTSEPQLKWYFNTVESKIPLNDQYLEIYRCIIAMYSTVHTCGLRFFDNQQKVTINWEQGVKHIRETIGFGRCWGRAQEALELIDNWRLFLINCRNSSSNMLTLIDKINIKCNEIEEKLIKCLESLLDGILEILPAYIDWIPKLQNEENTDIVNFLQKRGNVYRIMSNPKFYAYDKVITNIAKYNGVVTAENCKYIKGIGPKIAKHVTNFLNNKRSIVNIERSQSNNVQHNELLSELNSEQDNQHLNSEQYNQHLNSEQELEKDEQQLSNLNSVQHNELLSELNSEQELQKDDQQLSNLNSEQDDQQLPNLNSEQDNDQLSNLNSEQDNEQLPNLNSEQDNEKPKSLLNDPIENNIQQQIIDLLWNNGYKNIAIEIYQKNLIPLIKTHFKNLDNFDPKILNIIFYSNNDIPISRNWVNQELVNWLWNLEYLNLARTVANKINIITINNLKNIKNINENIYNDLKLNYFENKVPLKRRKLSIQ